LVVLAVLTPSAAYGVSSSQTRIDSDAIWRKVRNHALSVGKVVIVWGEFLPRHAASIGPDWDGNPVVFGSAKGTPALERSTAQYVTVRLDNAYEAFDDVNIPPEAPVPIGEQVSGFRHVGRGSDRPVRLQVKQIEPNLEQPVTDIPPQPFDLECREVRLDRVLTSASKALGVQLEAEAPLAEMLVSISGKRVDFQTLLSGLSDLVDGRWALSSPSGTRVLVSSQGMMKQISEGQMATAVARLVEIRDAMLDFLPPEAKKQWDETGHWEGGVSLEDLPENAQQDALWIFAFIRGHYPWEPFPEGAFAGLGGLLLQNALLGGIFDRSLSDPDHWSVGLTWNLYGPNGNLLFSTGLGVSNHPDEESGGTHAPH
ncbi:MAG: hypothetical protein ACREJQ_09130, partial [bacterium]